MTTTSMTKTTISTEMTRLWITTITMKKSTISMEMTRIKPTTTSMTKTTTNMSGVRTTTISRKKTKIYMTTSATNTIKREDRGTTTTILTGTIRNVTIVLHQSLWCFPWLPRSGEGRLGKTLC
ncbi:hypothetical protein GDO81_028682 [Engystomops pustulosus]|uniref:Uncharacterized protein n=1 Tax=Engystomops pustulosus TaxID=76066 RepID=A0AAV6YCW2_ENGPU|nr:hypothetical protein GDO81_028682 [Engystomops pustulosus]